MESVEDQQRGSASLEWGQLNQARISMGLVDQINFDQNEEVKKATTTTERLERESTSDRQKPTLAWILDLDAAIYTQMTMCL
ncbi:hypothetical protein RRG08_066936 [Elysia crispata]|uniref:Uncharacterized protein n=1 Tax=Elysia crispata TaxID=231223 RepID=A0AAE1ANS6_9GAST|nr:hypothetical protein RRG08_066936 [Elysia crispata]